jgi:hypothetical protein
MSERPGVTDTERETYAQLAQTTDYCNALGHTADGEPIHAEGRPCPSCDYQTGDIVSAVVYGIGGRSETVSGTVEGYRRNSVVVATECHGRIVVPVSKIVG